MRLADSSPSSRRALRTNLSTSPPMPKVAALEMESLLASDNEGEEGDGTLSPTSNHGHPGDGGLAKLVTGCLFRCGVSLRRLVVSLCGRLLSSLATSSCCPRGRIRNFMGGVCAVIILGALMNLSEEASTTGTAKPDGSVKTGKIDALSLSPTHHPTAPPTRLPTTAPPVPAATKKQSPYWPNLQKQFGAVAPTADDVVEGSTGAGEAVAAGKPSDVPLPVDGNSSAPLLNGTVYHLMPQPPMTNRSRNFTMSWCDLNMVEWYPSDPGHLWHRRVPAFLIPGAKFSGSKALSHYLKQHPNVVGPQTDDVKFFYEKNFRRYVTKAEKTHVFEARERLYAGHFYDTVQLKNNPDLITFDASSGYLFYSSLLPRRVFCVAPWVKLVVILRDPIDRLLRHYAHQKTHTLLRSSLEEWVEKDIDLLRSAKFFVNSTNQRSQKEEDFAWYRYLSESVAGAVGRSIYSIQLRHWCQALRAIGRKPNESILLIRTEDFVRSPQFYYQRILKFLGLPSYRISDFSAVSSLVAPITMTTSNSTTFSSLKKNTETLQLDEKLRTKLKTLFEPYELRLRKTMNFHKLSFVAPPKGKQ